MPKILQKSSLSSADDNSTNQNTGQNLDPKDSTIKQKLGDAANRWFERNRSLVLRQTPIWAQSLVALMVSLGGIAIIGGLVFRIDEVVTVKGQLRSIGGTVQVKTPAGGRVAQVHFKDGQSVEKGQKLIQFDTRQAANQKDTLSSLITLEENQLQSQLKTMQSQLNTLQGRRDVLEQRLDTKRTIIKEMALLVEQVDQRLQYLEQQIKFLS